MYNPHRNTSRSRRNSFTEGFLAGRRLSRLDPFARIPSIVPFGRRPLDPFSVSDLRFHWLRAENHVLAQLRAGVHPLLIQQYAEELISPDGIGTVYFRSVVRIIGNLVAQGRFEGLLVDDVGVGEYLVMREVERAGFAKGLRERFLGIGELGVWARDEEIERCIARARSLDRKAEEELRELREEELRWAEEKYKATEDALQKALEEQEKRKAAAPQEANRSKRSRTSTAGPSIYPRGDGAMPAGYYGAQMAADSPQRGRTSTRQRDISPTPPPKTFSRTTVGNGRRPFSRRRDESIPPTPPPKDVKNATKGHRGHSQTRREAAPHVNRTHNTAPSVPRNNSRTRSSSRSRLGDWLQTNAAIPIPQSEHFYSNHATTGSNNTTTRLRNREPPPASMRGWDRVWNQTPSLFGSQRRSRSHSNTRERDTIPSASFSSQRQREGSRAREVSQERGGRSASIPRARNLNEHSNPEPRHFNNVFDPHHDHPPNFSRPRSVERGYRGTAHPTPHQAQNQSRNQHRNFSRPRTTPWSSRTQSPHPNIQTNGMFDPRDRIQTGFAETVETESTRRGRDGVAYADREVFGFRDPRDRIATGFAVTVRSFGRRSQGPSLRRR